MASQIIDTKPARVNRARLQTAETTHLPLTSGFLQQVRDQIWYRWWHQRQNTRTIRHHMGIDGPDGRQRVEQALYEQVEFMLKRRLEPCI